MDCQKKNNNDITNSLEFLELKVTKLSLIHPDLIDRVITDHERETRDNTNLDEIVDYIIDSDAEYEPSKKNKYSNKDIFPNKKFRSKKCKST